MTAPTLKARQQQRVREDLVASALAVIAEVGVNQVSVERILSEAGTSRSTLYAHFPDGRDGLLRAAYETAGREVLTLAQADAIAATHWRDRILAYASALIVYSSRAHVGHFYNVSGPHLMGMRSGRGIGSQGTFEAIRAELSDAIDAGDLASSLDVEAIATLLTSALRDAGIEASRDPLAARRYVAAMGSLLNGLHADRDSTQGVGA